jgi:hypothetical protein
MGGSQSTILNVDGDLLQTPPIDIPDKCSLIKCSPNISTFCNYDNEKQKKNNSLLLLIYIILLLLSMFLLIFIWKLKN